MDPVQLLQDEILNLRKKLMEKEAMLKQHMNQVRIVKVRCQRARVNIKLQSVLKVVLYNSLVLRINFMFQTTVLEDKSSK